jgi:DNA modification methylase
MDFYKNISPITEKTEVIKRVPLHPYFTSQPYSLIQKYISHYCAPGGVVLDLFGGSGTTLREALLLGNKGVHVDLLPWSCFIAKISTYSPEDLKDLEAAFKNLAGRCENEIQNLYMLPKKTAEQLKEPKGFPSKVLLPKNADVKTVGELFTQRNKVALWTLLTAIKKEENKILQDYFLFIYSGILARSSKTYWKDKDGKGGGDSGIYKVYRYWIPPEPDERNVWELFESRLNRVAKLIRNDNKNLKSKPKIVCGSATDVSKKIGKESVDYIFTDPPYAKHITYLDLSTMYNALLGFEISEDMKAKEAIEGGDNAKSQDQYIDLMRDSFKTAFEVLKPNRWMTVVFTHKDPEVFTRMIEAATDAGFQFINAVSQDTKRPSFHKINNSLTVLKGQMMLNFLKQSTVKQKERKLHNRNRQQDVRKLIIKSATKTIEQNKGTATFSQLVHELYEVLLSRGYLKNITEDLKNIETILDLEFQRKSGKNELVYLMKKKESGFAA